MFEMLAIHWNVNPNIVALGPLELRWYSVLFISGFILGWYIFKWFFKREGVPVTLLDPLLYTLLIGTIVGARLGHCLFYQPDYYLGSWNGFVEIFMPWKGGLASHGGTIALIIAMLWFSRRYGRKYDFDFLWILDRLCITVCFAAVFISANILSDEKSALSLRVYDLKSEMKVTSSSLSVTVKPLRNTRHSFMKPSVI